jgi:hypothetical protein
MSKKKDKAESSLRPEISRELDKIRLAKKKAEKSRTESWPRQEKIFEQSQQARIKDVERKALKDKDHDKHRKADKKIGGVRGKFHPSTERTRKRT